MIPYLHILIRIEDDGSLHALGAFTSKEKLEAYQADAGLEASQVRLDFHNGPFEEDIRVLYAGHKRWNMNSYQQAGYFLTEGEAWNDATEEGYVSLLRIDTTYAEEQRLQEEALALYNKLQKRWRLASYEDLIKRQGAEKVRADITLRFYEDALESFRPKTRRDVRALIGCGVGLILLLFAMSYYNRSQPTFEENVRSVDWLPSACSNISYYRSGEAEVYEFDISPRGFILWAESQGMRVEQITRPVSLSRYKAFIPARQRSDQKMTVPDPRETGISLGQFDKLQNEISVTLEYGMRGRGERLINAVYDGEKKRAYVEHMKKQ